MGNRRRRAVMGTSVLALLLAFVPVAGQQAGTITGTVTEDLSQRPLVGVQVYVVGTGIGTVTGTGGRYTLTTTL